MAATIGAADGSTMERHARFDESGAAEAERWPGLRAYAFGGRFSAAPSWLRERSA
jgi:hypothetical protein